MEHKDVVDADAELIPGDLREGGFLALAVRGHAGQNGYFAAGLDLDGSAFPATSGRGGRRSHGADFAVSGNANSHQAALRAGFGLLFAESLVVDHFQRLI